MDNERTGTRAGGSAPRGRGFSLVELLVVIAIISVLVSLVAPSLRRAKYLARVGVCLSNSRQQHLAW